MTFHIAAQAASSRAARTVCQSMQDLQAANFAITELGLYLDTHADDEEAVQLFNQYVEQYEMLRQQAEDSGMALTQMEAAAGGCYTWLDDPWPWDAETEE